MNEPWRPNTAWLKPFAKVSAIGISLLPLFSISANEMAEETEAASVQASPEQGKAAYGMYCQACHGPEDTSIDSPSNLFDLKWYHGDKKDEVETSIRKGIMEKGMPAWGEMISDEEIASILAYLFTFQTAETTDQ